MFKSLHSIFLFFPERFWEIWKCLFNLIKVMNSPKKYGGKCLRWSWWAVVAPTPPRIWVGYNLCCSLSMIGDPMIHSHQPYIYPTNLHATTTLKKNLLAMRTVRLAGTLGHNLWFESATSYFKDISKHVPEYFVRLWW